MPEQSTKFRFTTIYSAMRGGYLITYEWVHSDLIAVFLDGKRIGKIQQVPARRHPCTPAKGFQYFPKGGRPGEIFPTLEECKKSLENEFVVRLQRKRE